MTENLPTRIKLPYKHLSLPECIDYDVPEEDLISSQHVVKHLKIWRSLFKTYLVDTKDLLEKSPTDGISFEVKPNRRGHFSNAELSKLKTKLFSLENNDWRKWYFLTLIYTGARRGEIASIRKRDIRLDEETSRWYIFIEDGKTEQAQRQIPLHRILESGLLNLAETLNDSDLIFFDLPNYTTATEEWAKLMNETGVPDYDEFGLKRRIHSLRHTFVSHCLASGSVSLPLMQFVVGHSRTQSLGVTSIYTHRPSLKDLLCVVDFQK
ncbi:TPA: tyrosine-type recombinase/integrase [Citrobacter freundii]|nr:tyrosine-type recombinase/integrase [Citrobacter werkmanii]